MEDRQLQELFDILTQLTAVKDLSLKNYREVSKILTEVSARLSSVLEQLSLINSNLVVVNDIIDKSGAGMAAYEHKQERRKAAEQYLVYSQIRDVHAGRCCQPVSGRGLYCLAVIRKR
jgi:hypothetical protein